MDLLDLIEHFNKKHKKVDNQYQCPLCLKIEFENLIDAQDHAKSDHLKLQGMPYYYRPHMINQRCSTTWIYE